MPRPAIRPLSRRSGSRGGSGDAAAERCDQRRSAISTVSPSNKEQRLGLHRARPVEQRLGIDGQRRRRAAEAEARLEAIVAIADAAKDAAILTHIDRIAARVAYLMPGFDPDDPGFQMARYWRGPLWAVVNWMIGTGLAEAGHTRWADKVRADTLALIEKNGFYEAFSPIHGSGSGSDDFSWTAAIRLAWAAT